MSDRHTCPGVSALDALEGNAWAAPGPLWREQKSVLMGDPVTMLKAPTDAFSRTTDGFHHVKPATKQPGC